MLTCARQKNETTKVNAIAVNFNVEGPLSYFKTR